MRIIPLPSKIVTINLYVLAGKGNYTNNKYNRNNIINNIIEIIHVYQKVYPQHPERLQKSH